MAFDDEQADILGGPILQMTKKGFMDQWSDFSFFFKGTFVLGIGFLAWLFTIHLRERYSKWQEKSYKLAMRRRYGIPDGDHRPFTVAYAAVSRARAEREAKSPDQKSDAVQRLSSHNASTLPQDLRQRFVDAAKPRTVASRPVETGAHQLIPSGNAVAVPKPTRKPISRSDAFYHSRTHDFKDLNFAERYDSDYQPLTQDAIAETVRPVAQIESVPPSRPSRKSLYINGRAGSDETRKRTLEDESEDQPDVTKKFRVEGDELFDGDEGAAWHPQPEKTKSAKRGSKRSLGLEAEADGHGQRNGRDKRARQVTKDQVADDEDVDMGDDSEEEDDEMMELQSIPRGKKRDRAEAGSTFGGDDEDDLVGGQEAKSSRRRKRRSFSRKNSERVLGKKRDRDEEAETSDDEVLKHLQGSKTLSNQKRGKKVKSEAVEDVQMGSSEISRDPRCKGRRIGEEWEANDIRYKVGDNGVRLRLALVKKAQNRFSMPRDSEHPDKAVALDIYVERWLTDQQYADAEARRELAGQGAPPAVEPQTPGDVKDSPSKLGKDLLWASTNESPAPRRAFRQSIATNVGLRINPFQQSQSAPGRRVASAYHSLPISPAGAAESPTRKTFRAFSKWEKQTLEAEAITKMRAQAEEKKAAEERSKAITSSATAPELGKKSNGVTFSLPGPAVKTAEFSSPFTFSKPGDKSADKPADSSENKTSSSSFTFGIKPDVSAVSKSDTTSNASVSPITTSFGDTNKAPTPIFSLGNKSAPSVSSTPTSTSSMLAVSSQQTQPSINSISSSSSIPNFFSKPAGGDSTPAFGTGNTPSAPSAPKFTFGITGGSAASAAPKPQTNGLTSPAFPTAFSGAHTAEKKSEDASQASSGTTGGSLLARLGAFAPQADEASKTSSTFAPPTSMFSFGDKYAVPASNTAIEKPSEKPTSVFGNSPSNTTHNASSSPSTSPASGAGAAAPAPLKFDFGIKPKSSSATPKSMTPNQESTSTAPAPSTSAVVSDPAKPSPTMFGFGPSAASTSVSAASAAHKTSPFIFEQSDTSAFGSTTAAKNGTEPKSAFGGFGGGSGGQAFGGAKTTSNGMAEKSTLVFGGTSPNKPTSVFGSTSIDKSASVFGGTSSDKPTSVFGGASSEKPTSVFGGTFGQGTNKPAPSAFGGFGNSAQTSGIFGKPNAIESGDESAKSAENSSAPKSAFGPFGSTATNNAFSTTPAGSPASGSANAASSQKPATFGFTAPNTGTTNTSGEPLVKPSVFGNSAFTPRINFGSTNAFGGSGTASSSTPSGESAPKPPVSAFTFGASSPFGQPSSANASNPIAPASSLDTLKSAFGTSAFNFTNPSSGNPFLQGSSSSSNQNSQQPQQP